MKKKENKDLTKYVKEKYEQNAVFASQVIQASIKSGMNTDEAIEIGLMAFACMVIDAEKLKQYDN